MKYTLKNDDRHAIRCLHDRLARHGLFTLMAAYSNEQERIQAMDFDLPLLPEKLRTMVELFIIGKPVKASRAGAALPGDIIEALAGLGVISCQDEHLSLNMLRLAYHCGILSFCEKAIDPAIKYYYGNDSLALGKMLLPARGKVLDVCAGVGTQGILCALTADKVIAVEQEPTVSKLFEINSVLNRVDDKIELRIGDLTKPVRGETFDRICCNPPLLPVPENVPYPVVGDGGPDGLRIVKRLIADLPGLLNANGRCQIIGSILGDESGPFTGDLESLARSGDLDIMMVLPSRQPLYPFSPMVESLAITSQAYGNTDINAMREAYLDCFSKQGASYLYSYLMDVAKPGIDRAVELTRHYHRNALFWSV